MTNLKIVDTTILKDWAKEIFTNNNFHMVDVSQKQNTHRKALAMGKIYVGEKTFKLIQNKQMPKGDPISLAEVAALLGVKKTSEIIPLCHPLTVDYSSTKIIQNSNDFSLETYCVVAAFAKTGVEMEALTGASIAALTIYDMCKALSQEMMIKEISLLSKTGGKSSYLSKEG